MKIFKLGFMLLLLLSFSLPSYAIVLTWDYTVSGAFENSVFVPGPDDGNNTLNGEYSVGPTELFWGVPAVTNGEQSGLEINPTSSSVNTYIGALPPSTYWANGISLVHHNEPIWSDSDRLSTTTLRTTVILDPSAPDNVALAPQMFNFDLQFVETSNSGPHPSDIFGVLSGFPNFNFVYDAMDLDGPLTYFVNVFPSDGSVLGLLTPEEATLLGLSGQQVIGFTTVEEAITTLPFAFTISTERIPNTVVPEPSTFILLGGGLAGLAFVARRRRKE